MFRVGLLAGSDNHKGLDWSDRPALQNLGSTDVYRLGGYSESEARVLHITKAYFRQQKRLVLEDYDILVNLVTDPDLNGKVLKTMDRVIKGYKGPVLNAPKNVLLSTRETVAKRMIGIENLLVPRVRTVKSLRAPVVTALEETGAIAFPAIVRRAGTHSGKVLGIARSAASLERIPASTQLHTLTEFIDFRSADGLFRKYRVFYFGNTPVFRHQLISDRWNVHMRDRARYMMDKPKLLEESQSLYARGLDHFPNAIRKTLECIYKRSKLDFCGIDFGILRDGRVVLFEANATMNFFPVSDDPRLAAMKACVPRGEEAFRLMIDAAIA